MEGWRTLGYYRARELHPVSLPQIVAVGPKNASPSRMCVGRVLEQREGSPEELHVVLDAQNLCILCRGVDSFEERPSSSSPLRHCLMVKFDKISPKSTIFSQPHRQKSISWRFWSKSRRTNRGRTNRGRMEDLTRLEGEEAGASIG